LLQPVGTPRPKIYINKVANSLNGALKLLKQRRVRRISTKIDFIKWLDAGYRVFPLNGKHPHWPSLPLGADNTPSWLPFTQREPTLDEIYKWENQNGYTGVAVLAGSVSGIVAFDYDCINKNYPEILKLVPESPIVRIGKRPKWMRIYKFSEELRSLARSKVYLHFDEETDIRDGIELLSDGRYFVADGVHPETKENYLYVDEHLLDFDKEKLPEFPLSTWLQIVELAKKHDNKASGSNKSQIGKGGRHNELLELCGALVAQKIPDRDIVYQLETLDGTYNESYFKTHKNTPERMLDSVKKTHTRNNPVIEKPVVVEKKIISKDILDCGFFPHDSLPTARGKHADFIKYCLSESQHDEPTLHFMSGMAWLSALLSNRLALKFRGTFWPANILAFGVADSGHGKNVPNKALYALFKDLKILGHDDYTSSVSLLSEFVTVAKEKEKDDGTKELKVQKRGKRELLCVLDEVDSILLGMKDGQSFEKRLAKVVIQIYDASRDSYSGQLSKNGGTEGRVTNPYMTMTGTTQPAYFEKSLQGDIIYKGIYQRCFLFIPRFIGESLPNNQKNYKLLGELKQFTKERIEGWEVKLKTPPDISSDGTVLFSHSQIDDTFLNCEVDYRPIDITEDAKNRLEEIIFKIHELISKNQKSDERDDVTSSILSRVLEKTIKAASVDWLSVGGKGPLTIENVEWGFQVSTYNIKQIRNLFLRSSIKDSKSISLENDIARLMEFAAQNNGEFIKYELTKKNLLRGSSKEYRDKVLIEAVDRGLLTSTKVVNEKGRDAILFKVVQSEAI